MAATSQRESRFERQMSPGEALMWNVEKDPWLNPSGASVSVLDGSIDIELLGRWIAAMAATVPRLRERVQPGIGRLEPPKWVADGEFDLQYHLRHIALPAPGSRRQFLDLVAVLFQDPFDRTRPLWQVIAIDGLEGGQSAIVMKLHHSIDGYGMARLQERFMVADADREPPAPVDLDEIVADAVARESEEAASESGRSVSVRGLQRPAELIRRAAAESMLVGADPRRLGDHAVSAAAVFRTASSQLRPNDEGEDAGSPLWTGRSRHRRLEVVTVPLDGAKDAAKALGGSINDLFMTAVTEGAVRYHEARGASAVAFNTSFVVSTRSDASEGGNSFSPVRVRVPGAAMGLTERFKVVHERLAAQRGSFTGGGLMGGMATVANLLPTSVTTRVA